MGWALTLLNLRGLYSHPPLRRVLAGPPWGWGEGSFQTAHHQADSKETLIPEVRTQRSTGPQPPQEQKGNGRLCDPELNRLRTGLGSAGSSTPGEQSARGGRFGEPTASRATAGPSLSDRPNSGGGS